MITIFKYNYPLKGNKTFHAVLRPSGKGKSVFLRCYKWVWGNSFYHKFPYGYTPKNPSTNPFRGKFDTDKKAIAIYLPEIAIAHIFDATNLTQYFCTGNP